MGFVVLKPKMENLGDRITVKEYEITLILAALSFALVLLIRNPESALAILFNSKLLYFLHSLQAWG
jgi:hypothetical protein